MIHTHYDNLKVSQTAPAEVIKAAYKTLAQKYHPDRNPGDADAARIMRIINEAYEILSDPIKRAEYDKLINEPEKMKNNFYDSNFSQKQTNKKNDELPEGIKGWSWGMFLLAPIWLVVNGWWLKFLIWLFVPFSSFIMGFKGREWAWRNKKWKSVEYFNHIQKKWSFWASTIYILLIVTGMIAAIAIPAYQNKLIRNQVVTEMNGIKLGMRPVEVTLAKGRPSNFSVNPEINENGIYLNWNFYYSNSSVNDYWVTVDFYGKDINSLKVDRICSNRPAELSLEGVPYLEYTGEKELINKLGKPTHISIFKDGTSKLISYQANKVAFEFTRNEITQVCVSNSEVSYTQEYSTNNTNEKDSQNNEAVAMNSIDENESYIPNYSVGETSNSETTYPTSFDCSQAKSIPENLICRDPKLAEADLQLARLINHAKLIAADKEVLTERLRNQWNYREKNCFDSECVAAWFTYMNNELNKIILPKQDKVETSISSDDNGQGSNIMQSNSIPSDIDDREALSYSEKSAIELACITAKASGAASYNRCLVAQIEELKNAPRQPNLNKLSYDEKSAIELACITAKANGAASYNRCLVEQVKALENAPSAPF